MLSKAARRTGQRLAPEAIAFRDAGATRDINLKGEDAIPASRAGQQTFR